METPGPFCLGFPNGRLVRTPRRRVGTARSALGGDGGRRIDGLADAIGPTLVIIHHIGSTAIPGIMAKPTIDFLPVVRSLAVLDTREDAVRALGYDWRGEFGLAGRRLLTLTVNDKRLFNVHCYDETNPDIARHLAFRDYLRAHPAIARDYEAQKIRAAEIAPFDVLAYNDAKNDWIKATERDALAWAGRGHCPPKPDETPPHSPAGVGGVIRCFTIGIGPTAPCPPRSHGTSTPAAAR